jgi:Tetratricopeptide repeat
MRVSDFPRVTGSVRVAPFWVFLACAVGALGQTPATLAAAKKTDKREIEARHAFAAGRYKEAADLFAELYAEKPHPTYLRNIGRCYQNLHQPDQAINAFHDYLRQAKDLSAAERAEIDGYVAEMETLKKKQEKDEALAATPPPASPAPPASSRPPSIPLVGPGPVAPAETPASETLVQAPTAPAKSPSQPEPFYARGWFWGVVGGAVVLGVAGGLWAGGVFSKTPNHCPVGAICPP